MSKVVTLLGHGTFAQPPDKEARFPIVLASEAMDWPPPVYWDADELFLRASGGSVSMIYADFSNCKTTFAVCQAIAIAKEKDARVLYIAAEGVGFLGPKTLLGAVLDWNNTHPEDPITGKWIDEHFHLIVVAPKIIKSLDLKVLKEEQTGWEPNLVFLDTLGASAAGQNLAAMDIGTEIGQTLRQFCQDGWAPYVSDVFVVHHVGKDKTKGATGSQYFMNDPDQALELTYLQDDGLLQVKVEKARGGEKGRKVMFGVRKVRLPTKEGGVTVAVHSLAKEDPRSKPPAPERQKDKEAEQVYQALRTFGPAGTLVSQDQLLAKLVVKEPCESEDQFQARRDGWRKNKLPRLVWQAGNKAKHIPGRTGKI
jgi:hypothetical protein